MSTRHVMLCMGTRPEIIKLAPVYHALRDTGTRVSVLHTGQHGGLAESLYRFFEMPPAWRLEISRGHHGLGHLFGLIIEGLEDVLDEARPDALLVQGDTSSALAGALAAYYCRIPVGHVEAGLRSGNRYEPFPEEKNRELIARLAQWHFAPTDVADQNLAREGIHPDQRYVVGNSIVDAVRWARARVATASPVQLGLPPDLLAWLNDPGDDRRLILVTAHRRESWDGQIAEIARGIGEAARTFPEIRIVWPVHPNPVVRDAIAGVLSTLEDGARDRVRLTEPLLYPGLLWLLERSWLVMTDSGGIQEEAVTLQVPVLVLRDHTERPEVTQSGAGALIGTRAESIVRWIGGLLAQPERYQTMKTSENPFGDGQAAKHIAAVLQTVLDDKAPATQKRYWMQS